MGGVIVAEWEERGLGHISGGRERRGLEKKRAPASNQGSFRE